MKTLENLKNCFRKLQGVGPRQAERFTLHYLRAPEAEVSALIEALKEARKNVKYCAECFNYAEDDLCPICADKSRDKSILCVVQEAKDIEALEKTKVFKGVYHVLHGAVSPIEGKNIDNIKVRELLERVQNSPVEIKEVILATNPDSEGEMTALYLADLLRGLVGKISRLGYGVPLGAQLDYIDEMTLSHSLKGRTKL